MIEIIYPEQKFRMKQENGIEYIFDQVRRVWLVLNEEEWVRQNFVQYLVQTLQYPSALIAVEKEILLGELKKRFDILVYNRDHQPWMLIECKAPGVKLEDPALLQVLRYNVSVPVRFLVITNGHYTYGWEKEGGDLRLIERLPDWE
jgi:hypothetical protein